ncbi:MAG: RNA-processing protein, partial [Methanomicrobiales archaeon]|nr:RNA-processing protein [Methanomicrobiales archaeon]
MTTRQETKVSTTRIGVLIGRGGSTKREIEEKIGITLSIDSEEGTVVIEGDEPIAVMTATNVVQAI